MYMEGKNRIKATCHIGNHHTLEWEWEQSYSGLSLIMMAKDAATQILLQFVYYGFKKGNSGACRCEKQVCIAPQYANTVVAFPARTFCIELEIIFLMTLMV